MAIMVLARHGRTEANATGVLAGWLPGVGLDERGRGQAQQLGDRLAGVPVVALVSSPLERCRQTGEAILAARGNVSSGSPALSLQTEDRLGECRYGGWTGRSLKELAAEPLWRTVQDQPSAVTFPAHDDYEHESMQEMHDRAVNAVADWDAQVERESGPGAIWVALSHGDVIKAILAHALGSDLDRFQRIVVDPASVCIVRHTAQRPFVVRVNDTGTDPIDLSAMAEAAVEEARQGQSPGDAAVGGGAGSDEAGTD
jgi:probable phosphomutase (TIGR03848 family)